MLTEFSAPWKELGLAVGHATDEEGATGLTVIRGIDSQFRCAAHLLGRASGTRELAVCQPEHVTGQVDAVMLTGGSAYGLDAAAGVMRWMEERGRGFAIGSGVVPIVPAATIFDLAPLGSFAARPTSDMAYAACESASSIDVAEGSVGAGTGATVGKTMGAAYAMKGGVGCGTARNGELLACAIVVTNSLGDVQDTHGAIIAGARTATGDFANGRGLLQPPPTGNTTIALVAVNAALSKLQLAQLAAATGAAFYRRIVPCGTQYDGDVIFAACRAEGIAAPVTLVEATAVAAMELAIERSVRLARGGQGIPGLADIHDQR